MTEAVNPPEMKQCWQFWIDVGGTFTDCIASSPQGEITTIKVLSSGAVRGTVSEFLSQTLFRDEERIGEGQKFWVGTHLTTKNAETTRPSTVKIVDFEPGTGLFHCDKPHGLKHGDRYEITTGEPAPIVAIRIALDIAVDDPLPEMTVRLGTTRGTNALLTRTGARTAFVVTEGFADLLEIGDQSRPRLFDLAICKQQPLPEVVLPIPERISAEGDILTPLDESATKTKLQQLRSDGIESVAICLLNAFRNDAHEKNIGRLATELGFQQVSISSQISSKIKVVPRAETTVADAYLTPILRGYIDQIAKLIPNGDRSLKLMTSAGGLISASKFSGKDSILSGPAGGVVGFARVAAEEGFERAIGFDMGGTSTDVARFDGEFEYEQETVKAGVRLSVPTLAIETVAAGGGSICGFDGVRLTVGPKSSGADPGPACYGHGGPLSITDVNVALRLVPEDRFPFPLDHNAVRGRIKSRIDEIAESPMGKSFTVEELASGYRRIAVESMARAIRSVSVSKGFNPAEHGLVAFGGAGPQFACAVARALGIREILISPYAGVLSAFGIGHADVRRSAEWAVLKDLNAELFDEQESLFEQTSERLIRELRDEGIPSSDIASPRRFFELRYRGAETTLTVPLGASAEKTGSAFGELHEGQFGYRRKGRLIEVVSAEIQLTGHTSGHDEPPLPRATKRVVAFDEVAAWFDGSSRPTPLYRYESLNAETTIEGPAIICDASTTIVIEPGFTASMTDRGNLKIVDSSDGGPSRTPISDRHTSEPDPVLLEIFHHRFASIAEQMGNVLQRTALSTNVKERLDFSCAVFSSDGELVANAPHIPVHLGAMSETVKRVIRDVPDLAAGDVIVTNDPFGGGSHLPDVTVVSPVHDVDGGERLYFTASRAHHAEIGGIDPGSVPPFSKNLAEEGVLIRNFRLVSGGRSNETELRDLLGSGRYPSRNVDENLAEIEAQLAANRRGAGQLLALTAETGRKTVTAYMKHIRRASAEKIRLALQAFPNGETTFTDHLDDGSPICVRIEIKGGEAVIDFTGTGPVIADGNLNANRAIVTSAVLYALRCLIAEDIPLNGGVLDPVDILLPECLLNPPEHDDPAKGAAVVGGNVETSQRVVDVLLGAFGLAAASQGTMNNLTFGDDSFGYYETICGGSGATRESDGADAVHTHMTNTRLTDVEVLEHRYPIRVRSFGIRHGSGGGGARAGGDGIVREIEFLKPLQVAMLSERRGNYRPFGLEGGEHGQVGRNLLIRPDGARSDLGGKFRIRAEAGDILRIETPGGGGFGTSSREIDDGS
ncbi:hydantoinase B/oxoprolinase family protein [Stratiformator vulcanicus]|nr:hydantoinase B/oxoprolinase family protein [Stratiformator vulcanicus]